MKADLCRVLNGLEESNDKFSKLAISLNKLFKKNSVQGLSKRLDKLNNKKTITTSMKELEEFKAKKLSEKNNIFNEDLDLKIKVNKKSPTRRIRKNSDYFKENKYSIGKINLQKINLKHKFSEISNKALTERHHPMPEPGKYNPNYNSIEKKVPIIIFRKPLPKPSLLPSLRINEALSTDRRSNEPLSTDRRSTKNYDETIKSKYRLKLVHSNKKSKMGFSLDLPRKDILINKCESNVLSYIEPEKINSGRSIHSLDFKKMRTRNFEDFIISKFTPGVATYNPNYKAVSNSKKLSRKSLIIALQTNNIENRKKSRIYVQKMLSSYHVSVDYQTVKLKSMLAEKSAKIER